jgi:hypothetical protein
MQIILTQDGYTVDGGDLSPAQLYKLAFDSTSSDDEALRFLVGIATSLVRGVQRDPDIELTRTASPPEPAALFDLLRELPYVLGSEFVNLNWIEKLYNQLAGVFNAELAAFDGTAAEYLHSRNNSLTVCMESSGGPISITSMP